MLNEGKLHIALLATLKYWGNTSGYTEENYGGPLAPVMNLFHKNLSPSETDSADNEICKGRVVLANQKYLSEECWRPSEVSRDHMWLPHAYKGHLDASERYFCFLGNATCLPVASERPAEAWRSHA